MILNFLRRPLQIKVHILEVFYFQLTKVLCSLNFSLLDLCVFQVPTEYLRNQCKNAMHFHFVGFTDLSLNDQMRLLQGSWSEVLTLSLVFRTLPTSVAAANAAAKDTEAGGLLKRRLKFAPDFALTEAMALQIDLEEFYHHVSSSQK